MSQGVSRGRIFLAAGAVLLALGSVTGAGLHAALEAGSERVELLRARLQDLDRASGADSAEGVSATGCRKAEVARLASGR